MSCYTKKQWHVTKQHYSYGISYELTTVINNKDTINSKPMTFFEANNFKQILYKLKVK